MRLAAKLARLGTTRAWHSAGQAVLRWLHPLPADRFLSRVDADQLRAIAARYGRPDDPGCRRWPKYVDARRWLALNARRVHDLGLNRVPRRRRPLRILDLGSGAGYFLFLCEQLGHRGLGLDLDEPALYGEMFALFGLRRVIWRIEPFVPLPAAVAGPFDLVTAFSVKFNGHETSALWGPAEWGFLFDDLAARLAPGGRVYVDLNPNPPDGSFYDAALAAFFRARGARVDRSKVSWQPRPAPPAAAAGRRS